MRMWMRVWVLGLWVTVAPVSAFAQITFELDRNEPEYPFIGEYQLMQDGSPVCTLNLTDDMRLFEGFKVRQTDCPAPFDKAQAWLLKPDGATIEILGSWDRPVWQGTDADGDKLFAGLTTRGEAFALAAEGYRSDAQPMVFHSRLQEMAGVYVMHDETANYTCSFALIPQELAIYRYGLAFDRDCIRDHGPFKVFLDAGAWEKTQSKDLAFYRRNGERIMSFRLRAQEGQPNTYVQTSRDLNRPRRNIAHKVVIAKSSDLQTAPLVPEAIAGVYTLSIIDLDEPCQIGLEMTPTQRGRRARLFGTCSMDFEVSEWGIVEDRVVLFSAFGEQTAYFTRALPGVWVGLNTKKQGLRMEAPRAVAGEAAPY